MKKVVKALIFIVLIIGFIYFGTKDYHLKDTHVNEPDVGSESSSGSTNIGSIYTDINGSKVLRILNKGNGIILMGLPNNEWTTYYATMLSDVARNLNMEEVYYYDFYTDRHDNNGTYNKIVEMLDSHLYVLDGEHKALFAPTLLIIKDGNIVSYDAESSVLPTNITVSEYWTEAKKLEKVNYLTNLLSDYLSSNEVVENER